MNSKQSRAMNKNFCYINSNLKKVVNINVDSKQVFPK